MTTAEKYSLLINEKIPATFEAGKAQGGGDLADYLTIQDNQWSNATFPEGYEFVLRMNTIPRTLNNLLYSATGVKTATLICEAEAAIYWTGVVRGSTVEVLDLTRCKLTPTSISYFALGASNLVMILGELDMSSCTSATNSFNSAFLLQEIRFKESTISIALDFHWSTKLSAESYNSIIKGYLKEANVTLTLPPETTVRSVYDAVYGNGAWDAITAEYSNMTISYM